MMSVERGLTKSMQNAVSGGMAVFTYEAFKPAFCADLLRRIDKHRGEAPNSMNKYGVDLASVGLGDIANDIMLEVVKPLAKRFYPNQRLSRVYGFAVRYEPGKQRSLSAHFDESKVTFNLCLGPDFEGGDLEFIDSDGKSGARIEQHIGQGILHLGAHVHRAKPITYGKRTNLILWCK